MRDFSWIFLDVIMVPWLYTLKYFLSSHLKTHAEIFTHEMLWYLGFNSKYYFAGEKNRRTGLVSVIITEVERCMHEGLLCSSHCFCSCSRFPWQKLKKYKPQYWNMGRVRMDPRIKVSKIVIADWPVPSSPSRRGVWSLNGVSAKHLQIAQGHLSSLLSVT